MIKPNRKLGGKGIIHELFLQFQDMYDDTIVWILAGNGINFSVAVGFFRLHMPGVK